MMVKFKRFLAASLLVSASAAFADDGPTCNPEGNQQEMNVCAYEDYQKADKALNETYKKAVNWAKEQDDFFADQPDMQGAMKALKKAQRAWIDYRDGQCDSYGFNARGGTMEPLLIYGCMADLTQKRTRELKELIAYPEDVPADEQ